MQLAGKHPAIIAKTADFTLSPTTTRCGTQFTNEGAAGAVTCSLPQLNAVGTWVGYWVEFFGIADQTFGFATVTASKAITINNAAANSLKAQTGSQKIGARIRATWQGTKWELAAVAAGPTYTVA